MLLASAAIISHFSLIFHIKTLQNLQKTTKREISNSILSAQYPTAGKIIPHRLIKTYSFNNCKPMLAMIEIQQNVVRENTFCIWFWHWDSKPSEYLFWQRNNFLLLI